MSSAIVPTYSKQYSGFTPTSIPGCALWLDAADSSTLTLTGSNVTLWKDKSGNGRNPAGSGGTILTTINGNTAITLNGTDTYFYFTNATAVNNTPNLSAFVVATFGTGMLSTQRLLGFGDVDWNTSTNCVAFEKASGVERIGWERGSLYASGSVALTTPVSFIGSVVFTSSNVNQWVNGTSNSSGTYSFATFNYSLFNIGRYSGGGLNWKGAIAEVIAYNDALSTTQRQQVEGYLAWKWGLVSNIPTTHPFKLVRPFSRQFSPVDISGCSLWLDAADAGSMTLSGSVITQWRDKSGNANNPSLFASPTYVTSPYPCLATRSSNQYLTVPNTSYTVTSGQSGCIFFVYADTQTATATNNTTMYGTGTPFDYFNQSLKRTDSQPFWISSTSSPAADVAVLNSTNIVLYCLRYTHGSSAIVWRLNGTTSTLANVTSAIVPTGALTISAAGWSLTGSYCNLNLCEILSYKGLLTVQQIQVIEGYLANKWARLASIPATHPFKLYPPLTTLFNPLQISNCVLWLDAADTTTITGTTTVTAWTNKGTLGGTATNRTNSCSSGNTINKLNYINCPSGAELGIALPLVTQARSWFFVSRKSTPLTSGNFFSIVGQTAGGGQDAIVGSYTNATTTRIQIGPSGSFNAVSADLPTATLQSMFMGSIINSTSTTLNRFTLNGTVQTLVANVAASSYNTGNAIYTINRASFSQEIDSMEVIFYYGDLSQSDRQQIEGYLAWKWGIQNSLPTTHPYYKFRP